MLYYRHIVVYTECYRKQLVNAPLPRTMVFSLEYRSNRILYTSSSPIGVNSSRPAVAIGRVRLIRLMDRSDDQ